jgi:RNA polymerase sigma factor (sigma-70 family)
VSVPTDRTDSMQAETMLERARLVRLCARLTGNVDAAEDLAQETLLEAWRHSYKLHDPQGRDRWLAAIARNVCRRWAREQGRALPRLVRLDESYDCGDNLDEEPADDFDVDVELERHELAELLDRALGLLPATTRQVLLARYVHDSPHAEIAARLGLSVDAVAMRLTRGKLLLRRALTAELREEATAYGFYHPDTDGWQETRIWGLECGRHRLLARFPQPPGTVSFRCPACHPDPKMTGSDYRLTNAHFARLIGRLTRPRTILKRTAASTHAYYRKAIDERAAVCTNCGHPARFRLSLHDDTSTLVADPHLLYVQCVQARHPHGDTHTRSPRIRERPLMLATLRQRNFALLWCAGLISLIGDRAMMTALPFYVYQQTGATLATAALFTAAYLPMVLLGSVAGVFVDRWDRKRIMVLTNLIQTVIMLLLLLVRSSTWLWLVLLVAFVETSVAMFFGPAEKALLPRLVGEDQLIPANALAGLNDNIARLAGPPIGGALIGFFGLDSVAIVDSASFLIAAVLISLISVSSRPPKDQVDVTDAVVSSWLRVWREWLDGLKVVRRDRLIAALFVVLAVTSLGGTIIDPLYAPFVRSVLHGGAAALGWLSTTGALGGLLGGLIVGQLGRKVSPRHLTGVSTVVVGMLMLVMYNQTSLPLVIPCLATRSAPENRSASTCCSRKAPRAAIISASLIFPPAARSVAALAPDS